MAEREEGAASLDAVSLSNDSSPVELLSEEESSVEVSSCSKASILKTQFKLQVQHRQRQTVFTMTFLQSLRMAWPQGGKEYRRNTW